MRLVLVLGDTKTSEVVPLKDVILTAEGYEALKQELETLRTDRRREIADRIRTAREIEDLLLADFLVSPWCLAVEWPERIADWLPAGTLHLELGIAADERHTLRLRGLA